MLKRKRSFFERLTGAVNAEYDNDDDYVEEKEENEVAAITTDEEEKNITDWTEDENGEGQLAVDVYQTDDDIIVKAMIAGVRPEDVDVSITRDMVTIKGKREEARHISEENFFQKELYWGAFSRTVLLPQEIDVDGAEAAERHGLLIIRLPKVDKGRQTKLKVRPGA
jgi:HSP20 family protein